MEAAQGDTSQTVGPRIRPCSDPLVSSQDDGGVTSWVTSQVGRPLRRVRPDSWLRHAGEQLSPAGTDCPSDTSRSLPSERPCGKMKGVLNIRARSVFVDPQLLPGTTFLRNVLRGDRQHSRQSAFPTLNAHARPAPPPPPTRSPER